MPSLHFDRHLYRPLLVERGDRVESEPPGLNDSERQFVEDMRAYCRAEKDKPLADREVYLLRNLSRGKGIVSATSYEDLRTKYDDGTWDKERFAEKHILFREREADYDYIAKIVSRTSS